MRPDYKNWIPKHLILLPLLGAAVFFAAGAAVRCTALLPAGALRTALTALCFLLSAALLLLTVWFTMMYRAFDDRGTRRLSRQVVEGTASFLTLPAGGRCLDVGCGSGALTIAVAKRNPEAEVTGIDRWGREYAEYSRQLCERNAEAEGVKNVTFLQGDAVRLPFADGTFDAVTSNYVYHNIPARDRQALLLETLRTLKKGGTFAVHDLMGPSRYGDMQAFVQKLKDMGYRKVELIDTTDGRFMTRSEAKWMCLSGSALLTGIK